MKDYMMTMEAVDIDKIIGPAAQMFSERYGRQIEAKSIWPMFAVVPDFLNAALDGMMDAQGSIDGYVTEVLKVTDAEIQTVREHYLKA